MYDILQLRLFTILNKSSYYSWYAAMALIMSVTTST